jgi:hypothetical protein
LPRQEAACHHPKEEKEYSALFLCQRLFANAERKKQSQKPMSTPNQEDLVRVQEQLKAEIAMRFKSLQQGLANRPKLCHRQYLQPVPVPSMLHIPH